MSKFIVRPLPKESQQLDSIQKYQEACQDALRQFTGKAGQFQLDQTIAQNNRSYTDGQFFLYNNDKTQDFFCHGRVNTFNRELDIRVGRLSEQQSGSSQKIYQHSMINMLDQCTLTRQIAGEEELGGKACTDGNLDPHVATAAANPQLVSLQLFAAECSDAFENHVMGKMKTRKGREFSLERAYVDRAQANPAFYQIRFESPETKFYCQAEVDRQAGLMLLTHGSLDATPYQADPSIHLMTDGCALSAALEVPNGKECTDKSITERKWDNTLSHGLGEAILLLGIYTTWKGATRVASHLLTSLAESSGWIGFQRKMLNWRLPMFYNWRSGLKNLKTLNAAGQEVALLSRADRLAYAAATPTAPWHRTAKWMSYGSEMLRRTGGPAYLMSLGYDALATQFVDRHHAARSIGTPVVGLGGMGALAIAEHRAVQQSIAKGVATKSLISRIPAGAAAARLGNRLLLVGLFDFGMRYLAVGSDYEASVNERITEQVYQQDRVYNVFTMQDWVDDGLLGWTKPIRGGVRWLAPSAMEWAVSMDNPEIEAKIRGQDQMDSIQAKKGMKELLLSLALNQNYESESQHASEEVPAVFDFSKFTHKAPPLNVFETILWQSIRSRGFAKTQETFDQNETELETIAQQALLVEFQNNAVFLRFVPGSQNDWARKLFNEAGLLRFDKETALITELYGSADNWGEYTAEMKRSLEKQKTDRRAKSLALAEIAHTIPLEH